MYDANKTVRELTVELPHAVRVFEGFGIDYCCGGAKPLADACKQAKVSLDDVMQRLEEASPARSRDTDWTQGSITSLIDHIVARHHTYVKQELPRLQQLIAKVSGKHGEKHPELYRIKTVFSALSDELNSHLMKEETILFPYLYQLEQAQAPARGNACFGTVRNPIHMMELEHDSAGDALRELRQITNQFTPPEDGCTSYQMLYRGLQEFEADLHRHIHLENNILFPRAVSMEAASRS